ncbi:MAG: 16S rRNA (cytidine(1402)-2'-O)-methyltransferase [Nitrosomonas sp.]|nr:16S rRNA (cytidine(1402)-2'-O)-methyltransferase [Nitrosomonas sp.]
MQKEIKGILYVVATPIGNLSDITLRALEVLSQVKVIAAEHIQIAQKLLSRHGIATRTIPVHQHNESYAAEKIIQFLMNNESVALITDAGTPAISDPGAKLVRNVREQGFSVVPIPGANAAISALSASGLLAPHFFFYGFLPVKSAERQRKLAVLDSLYTCILVFYEAPHRVLETVADMVHIFGAEREIIFARELTKVFETIHACALGNATEWLQADSNRLRGEFVLLLTAIAPPSQTEPLSPQTAQTLAILQKNLPLKQAVQLTAEITGENRKKIYAFALQKQNTAS